MSTSHDDELRTEVGLQAERKMLRELWSQTKLLEGLEVEQQTNLAVLLENQRLWNESTHDMDNMSCFKRVSIPICVRVFTGAAANGITITSGFNPDVLRETATALPEFPWRLSLKDRFAEVLSRRQYSIDGEAKRTAELVEYLVDGLVGASVNSLNKTNMFPLYGFAWDPDEKQLVMYHGDWC